MDHGFNDPRQAIKFTMSYLYQGTYGCFQQGVQFILGFEDHTWENNNSYYSILIIKRLVLWVMLLNIIQPIFCCCCCACARACVPGCMRESVKIINYIYNLK
jgi:hypothetical protein